MDLVKTRQHFWISSDRLKKSSCWAKARSALCQQLVVRSSTTTSFAQPTRQCIKWTERPPTLARARHARSNASSSQGVAAAGSSKYAQASCPLTRLLHRSDCCYSYSSNARTLCHSFHAHAELMLTVLQYLSPAEAHSAAGWPLCRMHSQQVGVRDSIL